MVNSPAVPSVTARHGYIIARNVPSWAVDSTVRQNCTSTDFVMCLQLGVCKRGVLYTLLSFQDGPSAFPSAFALLDNYCIAKSSFEWATLSSFIRWIKRKYAQTIQLSQPQTSAVAQDILFMDGNTYTCTVRVGRLDRFDYSHFGAVQVAPASLKNSGKERETTYLTSETARKTPFWPA